MFRRASLTDIPLTIAASSKIPTSNSTNCKRDSAKTCTKKDDDTAAKRLNLMEATGVAACTDDAIARRPNTWMLVKITVIASFGGILFGYDLGVISGALPLMTVSFGLSSHQQQVIVSSLYLGAGVGAALGGSLCDAFGRRKAILITDVWFVVGAAVIVAAPSYQMVVFGRVVLGVAVALSGIADVSYLHEIAPEQWRGSTVSVNEACIALGFLLAFLAGNIFAEHAAGWRIMFGLSGAIAILQMMGMWFVPESPIWLKEQGRHEDSEVALRRIYSYSSVNDLERDKQQSASHFESTCTNTSHSYESILERPSPSSVSPDIISSGTSICAPTIRLARQAFFLLQQQKLFFVAKRTLPSFWPSRNSYVDKPTYLAMQPLFLPVLVLVARTDGPLYPLVSLNSS
jgi:MFS family permease